MAKGIEEKFCGYKFKLAWPSSEVIDPENEAVDVRLETRDGKEYSANFVTRSFLDTMFEKNRKTGECGWGTYFAMPGMVVVKRVDEMHIRRTIDEMIKNGELELYFSRIFQAG